MRSFIYMIGLLVFLGSASEGTDSFMVFRSHNGQLVLEAHETPLGKVLEEVRRKYGVEIVGLEGRKDELVTFSLKEETVEVLLKRLFRFLGETNYALQFAHGEVRRASVMPESMTTYEAPLPPVVTKKKKVEKRFGTVVRVKGVIEGSQADELGLKEGDLIISYDGVKITSTQSLVKETKKKSAKEVVEMTVVRDQEPMQLYLEGGFIGVRIYAVRILINELNRYYTGE